MINVIGLGYIGLPTALMMASHGVEVVGTDYNKELVATLNAGHTTFKEGGLDELFADAVKAGIKFTTEYQVTDTYIVSVPTPYDKFSKKVDACYVVAAVKTIMEVCPKGATVVVESTVSPRTIDKYVRPVIEENGFVIGKDINLVHAPERVIPGNMVYELLHNNRTIGADDKTVGEKIKELYSSFCQGEIVVTDIRTAEMTKVVENTFRAVNIAFANELAKICRHDNMDIYEIIKICNMHPRVNILQPGPGVGGHCISVDPWFLVGDYPSLAKVIDESMKTNDGKQIAVGHVEAGLRTYDIYSPYPEEFNRQAVGIVAKYNFSPTEPSKNNLLKEGKNPDSIYVTGNTAIDALKTTIRDDYTHPELEWASDSRLIVITAHRRENLGEPMHNMFRAIRRIMDEHPDVKAIYPIHMNPVVRDAAAQELGGCDRIHIIEPLEVLDFHNFLARSFMILTDSGGIQEEAPSLGKPVLVMRDTTERPEGIAAGTLKLVGTDEQVIYDNFKLLLENEEAYEAMSKASNPYGDGFACKRIADILESGSCSM